MKFSDIQPGRYPCRITDWALSEVPKLDNALKVTIQLDIRVAGFSETITGWWEGLLKKKDGSINEKTLKTLMSAGFHSTDIYSLTTDGDALDTQKEMEVTTIKDDQGRTRAEWLNSLGSGTLAKVPVTKKKDIIIEGALAMAIKQKKDKKSTKQEDDLGF